MCAGGVLLYLINGCLDGHIAGRYNSITNFGKALDPVADKLTQGYSCLRPVSIYDMATLVLVLKEMFAGITGLLVIRKTGNNWGGLAWKEANFSALCSDGYSCGVAMIFRLGSQIF